jgi:hypothetical protein
MEVWGDKKGHLFKTWNKRLLKLDCASRSIVYFSDGAKTSEKGRLDGIVAYVDVPDRAGKRLHRVDMLAPTGVSLEVSLTDADAKAAWIAALVEAGIPCRPSISPRWNGIILPGEDGRIEKGVCVVGPGKLAPRQMQTLRQLGVVTLVRSAETDGALAKYSIHGAERARDGVVYWKHPLANLLIPADRFHHVMVDLKLKEMQKIFLHLGAKRIVLVRNENNDATRGGKATVGAMGGGAGAGARSHAGDADSTDVSVDLRSPAAQSRAVQLPNGRWQLRFDARELGLVFYAHETQWQSVVEARQVSWAERTTCAVEHKDDCGLKAGLEAKVSGIGELSVGGEKVENHAVSLKYSV